jgi:hypothetical protein
MTESTNETYLKSSQNQIDKKSSERSYSEEEIKDKIFELDDFSSMTYKGSTY